MITKYTSYLQCDEWMTEVMKRKNLLNWVKKKELFIHISTAHTHTDLNAVLRLMTYAV